MSRWKFWSVYRYWALPDYRPPVARFQIEVFLPKGLSEAWTRYITEPRIKRLRRRIAGTILESGRTISPLLALDVDRLIEYERDQHGRDVLLDEWYEELTS